MVISITITKNLYKIDGELYKTIIGFKSKNNTFLDLFDYYYDEILEENNNNHFSIVSSTKNIVYDSYNRDLFEANQIINFDSDEFINDNLSIVLLSNNSLGNSFLTNLRNKCFLETIPVEFLDNQKIILQLILMNPILGVCLISIGLQILEDELQLDKLRSFNNSVIFYNNNNSYETDYYTDKYNAINLPSIINLIKILKKNNINFMYNKDFIKILQYISKDSKTFNFELNILHIDNDYIIYCQSQYINAKEIIPDKFKKIAINKIYNKKLGCDYYNEDETNKFKIIEVSYLLKIKLCPFFEKIKDEIDRTNILNNLNINIDINIYNWISSSLKDEEEIVLKIMSIYPIDLIHKTIPKIIHRFYHGVLQNEKCIINLKEYLLNNINLINNDFINKKKKKKK